MTWGATSFIRRSSGIYEVKKNFLSQRNQGVQKEKMSLFGNLLSPLKCPPGERVPEMSPQLLRIMSFFKAPDAPEIPTWEIGLKITFYIPSIVINLVGNSLVILILVFNKKMRTTTNLLILNLSVSDIFVACFCSWIHLVSQVTAGNQWLFGAFMCKFSSFAQGKS